jgi:hypothetical protein
MDFLFDDASDASDDEYGASAHRLTPVPKGKDYKA